ncbi:hypothetical protein Pcinc_032522 [Petrolisthes cinctipes]|uniref:FAD dependent oxidoreductase domain-containing protein n=1 Tax=Petrolisthes cinctipes TaxID=88211 RepID=A0AAE1K1A7_PETCI|nr:hypothetical protein Pcinc_032522 [Petrolisthes cinctipes]
MLRGRAAWMSFGGIQRTRTSLSCLYLHSSTSIPNISNTTGEVAGEVDVVVVGGGVAGCSCLYHLTKLGVTNAILLEAHKLTSGTTWHTAGLMSRMTRNELDFQLYERTYQLLTTLEEETGVNPGLRTNGSLYISTHEASYNKTIIF